MDDLQTVASSSPPVTTSQMPNDIPAWVEPKRKARLNIWDWREVMNESNACRGCASTGINAFGDYPDGVDTGVDETDDGICYLNRQFLYAAHAHGCQWALRGRETMAGFPVYLLRKAQDSFDWTAWNVKQLAYVAYRDDVCGRTQRGDGLVCIGSVGTGKTHLAVHAGRVAVRKGLSVFFTTVTDLLSDLRQTYHEGSPLTEKRIMEHVRGVDLLILDDATVEKQTDWTQDALYRVVNARYEAEKATILTANTSLDGMRDRLGERLVSRLYERSVVLDFTGPDYRLQIRKQRQVG